MQPEKEENPVRTNAEPLTDRNPNAVPDSTGYGVPEPEFVEQQPNRFPGESQPDAHFVAQDTPWAPVRGQAPQSPAPAPRVEQQNRLSLDFVRKLIQPNQSKIVFLVMDGLGGHPQSAGGPTELEAAHTPNLDALAAKGICGLQQPVATGITSGSGPGHLALFGYDPFTYQIGRGVLSALGIDFDLQARDVAARGNFCTVDEQGRITDRRAGRISSEQGQALCAILDQIRLPEVELFVRPEEGYRFMLALRGANLSAELADSDPQMTGVTPQTPRAHNADAERTAWLVEQFLSQARQRLADHAPANMVLLRGFAQRPSWPAFTDAYALRAAAIAAYPMYRGVARLLGMQPLETDEAPAAKIEVLTRHWQEFDFFFVHVKRMDSAGEDGDFERKVALIEEVDAQIPRLLALKPDVVVVTGDHSTPSVLRQHSWHPVPLLLWSAYCRPDEVQRFGERACIGGALGPRLPAHEIMPLVLANALRLEKFGA